MKLGIQGVVVLMWCVAGCTHFSVDPKEYVLNDGGEVKTYRMVSLRRDRLTDLMWEGEDWHPYLVEVPAHAELLKGPWKWGDYTAEIPQGATDPKFHMVTTYWWHANPRKDVQPDDVYWLISLRPRVAAVADEKRGRAWTPLVTRDDLDRSVKEIWIMERGAYKTIPISPPKTIREILEEQPWKGEGVGGRK